jgi:hypothetical protein
MTEVEVIKGDTGYDINFTLEDSNGNPYDLTTATGLLFRVQKPNGVEALKFSSAMSTVAPLTAGTCKYTVASTDFDQTGEYNAEIQVTFTGSKVLTFDDITIVAIPKIPYV